jgi:hypothetical protein
MAHIDLLSISTAVISGIITLIIYVWIIRPFLSTQQRQPQTASASLQQVGNTSAQSLIPSISKASRVPCHLSEPSARIASSGGANVLRDGLVAFSHTKAFVTGEQESTDPANASIHRTQRAKVLAKLMAYTEQDDNNNNGKATIAKAKTVLQAPPAKGSTLLVSVPADQVGCHKLQRVLYLLGTYYNVILILGVASESKSVDRAKLIEQLRGATAAGNSKSQQGQSDALPSEVIPDHRIILSSTAKGRIALVRQVERVELVLDYDPQVEMQLRRFKQKVITYGMSASMSSVSSQASSVLGNELLF